MLNKVLYLVSLVILAILLVHGFLWHPISEQEKYSEVQGESILQSENDWILQFNIINHEGGDTKYNIAVLVAGERYDEQFLVKDGGVYTYIHHIPYNLAGTDRVSFTIYKEAEDTPFEQATYYLN